LVYVAGVVIVFSIEFILRDVLLPKQPSDIHIGITVMGEWLVLSVLLFFWVPVIEGDRLGAIGFGKFKWRYLWMGLLSYLVLMVIWTGSDPVLKAIGLEGLRSLQPVLTGYDFPVLFSLFLTGTFLEEIFYRGYLIERLIAVTGKSWLAGLISWSAFTFVHLQFLGLGPTLDMGFISAALVILYLRERSIWPCVVLHGINNAFAYILVPLLIL
jgi:membrane protease YdiL (CAAX protease family)